MYTEIVSIFKHKRTYLVIIAGILLSVLFIVGRGQKQEKSQITQIPIPSHTRGYKLAMAYATASRGSNIDLNVAYEKIAEVAEIAMITGNWDDWLKNDYFLHDI